MGRHEQRRIPIEPITPSPAALRLNGGGLKGADIKAGQASELAFGVNEARIAGIRGAAKTIGTHEPGPVTCRGRRAVPATVVLHAATDSIRLSSVNRHSVELPDGQVFDVVPLRSAI